MNEAIISESGFLEMPLKWSVIARRLRYRADDTDAWFPDYADLIRLGKPVVETPFSMDLRVLPEDIDHLQEWLTDNVGVNYTRTGLFRWRRHSFFDEQVCQGVRFTFESQLMACMAKLKFHHSDC